MIFPSAEDLKSGNAGSLSKDLDEKPNSNEARLKMNANRIRAIRR